MAGRTEMRRRYCVFAFCRLPFAQNIPIVASETYQAENGMNFGGHSIQFDYFVILLKSLDLIARTLHRIGFGLFDFSAYLFSLWQTACTQKLDSRRAHRNKVEKNNNNSNVLRARCTITNKSMRAEERVMERMRRVEQLCGECGPFNCTQSPANVLINAHRFI